MVRRISIFVALAIGLAIASEAGAQTQARGVVTYSGDGVVEVGGKRLILTPDSHVTSGGRAISPGSVGRGMVAEAEYDEAGRLIELRVNGVVE